MITVSNYADLETLISTTEPAFVEGRLSSHDGGEGIFIYHSTSEVANGGTIIASDMGGCWKRVIEEKINVQWFGAVPDCYKGNIGWSDIPSGTPCHQEVQNAIDFCIKHGYDLYFPVGRKDENGIYGEYFVQSTLKIYAPINIYAESKATITGLIFEGDPSKKETQISKSAPIFYIENCDQGKIENLTIQGCAWLPLAGIQFGSAEPGNDSQAMELNNVKIYNCRYGVYTIDAESINRIVLNRCVFNSNLLAGFYLKSPLGKASGPITFINTILNGNGIGTWIYGKEYNGQLTYSDSFHPSITVLEPTDKYGFQLFASGFVNLSYFGGQISGHGYDYYDDKGIYVEEKSIYPKLLALIALSESSAGANFMGVDIEDIKYPVNETGMKITQDDYWDSNGKPADLGSLVGSAINVREVSGFNLIQSHVYRLDTQSVFKFIGNCGDVNIELMDLHYPFAGNFMYSVDVTQSNYGVDDKITRLTYTGKKEKLSSSAFNALDKSGMEVLTSVRGPIVPSSEMDAIFSHSAGTNTAGTKYAIGYQGTGAYINTSNALYIDKEIVYGTVFHAILECSQNSFDPDGIFFIQQLNGSTIIFEERVSLKGIVTVETSTTNKRFYNYLTCKLNPIATKIRYGFVNKDNYLGYVPDHATIKGFTTYIDYHNPIQKRRPVDMDF